MRRLVAPFVELRVEAASDDSAVAHEARDVVSDRRAQQRRELRRVALRNDARERRITGDERDYLRHDAQRHPDGLHVVGQPHLEREAGEGFPHVAAAREKLRKPGAQPAVARERFYHVLAARYFVEVLKRRRYPFFERAPPHRSAATVEHPEERRLPLVGEFEVRLRALVEDEVLLREHRRERGDVIGVRELSLFEVFHRGGRGSRGEVPVVEAHRGERGYAPFAAEPRRALLDGEVSLFALRDDDAARCEAGTVFLKKLALSAAQEYLVGHEGRHHGGPALVRERPGAQRATRRFEKRDGRRFSVE